MRFELLYQPSYAIARIMLDPQESIRAESGAMISMSPTISLDSKIQGGIGKALGRMFGGESIFQTTFKATSGPGEVLLAPAGPGDIASVEPGVGLMVTSGAYLAGDTSLLIETQASFKGFLAGEGLFMMKISGHGTLLLSSFGAIHPIQLGPGQQYIVDTGHLVAFSAGMPFEVRRATKGLLGSFTSGEGVVAHLTGPGLIYIQTRTAPAFAGMIRPFLPAGG